MVITRVLNYPIHGVMRLRRLCAILCLAALALQAQAADWQADLYGGGQIMVDPDTNRATITRYGVQTHLWDGVHRLQDGSTLTIRSGVVVPNKDILDARHQPDASTPLTDETAWQGNPIVGYSPCEKLVRRVCGTNQECAEGPACSPAQQLLDMEWQERRAAASPNIMTYSSGQCIDAESDAAFFVTCGQQPPPTQLQPQARNNPPLRTSLSACAMLVNKVCGDNDACAGQDGCDAARQLQELVREARKDDPVTAAAAGNPVAGYCVEGLRDEGFFPRCQRQ